MKSRIVALIVGLIISTVVFAGLETATYIHELVATNPVGATDAKAQGDDHMRLIKSTLQNTFSNITGPVTASHTELNILDGATLSTAELNILDNVTATASEINKLDGVTATTADLNKTSTLNSGTYAPAAIAPISNCFNLVAIAHRYSRVGNIVTVSGRVNLDVTTANVLTNFEVSIPIASTFSGNNNGAGAGANTTNPSNGVYVLTTTNGGGRLSLFFNPSQSGPQSVYYTAQYEVI